ncbi:MAG: FecR family protein [Cyclobacteriaceae bacterium]
MLFKEEKIFDYLNGHSSVKDQREVEEWISKSNENRIEFDKIKKIHEMSALRTDEYNPDVEKGWSSVSAQLFEGKQISLIQEADNNQSFRFNVIYRIAAILVLGIGLGYFFLNGTDQYSYALSYQTKEGEVKVLELTDGSIVHLNENTEFKYFENNKGQERNTYLNGEAYFEIAKDKNRPFQIQSPSAQTKVLGTSFNLITSKKHAIVDVFSGRVEFGDLANANNSVILEKGERAVYKDKGTTKLTGFDSNIDSWKTGKLKFESTPLSKVVEHLEKQYKVKIEYKSNIANCLITSTFEDKSIDEVLSVIEIIAQIKFSKSEGKIQLSGKGC